MSTIYEKLMRGEPLSPEELASPALHARCQDEALGIEPEAWTRFLAEHDGMTPLQVALVRFPDIAESIYEKRPDLRPPMKEKPPPDR